jgi:type IV conjugative transfer system coupling protein TraD
MIGNYVRGGQLFMHKLRMLDQVIKKGVCVSVLLSFFLALYISKERIAEIDYSKALSYIKAYSSLEISKAFGKGDIPEIKIKNSFGKISDVNANKIINSKNYKSSVKKLSETYQDAFWLFVIIFLLVSVCLSILVSRFGSNATKRELISDSQIYTATKAMSVLKATGKASDIVVSGMPLVKNKETSHILITGTTGSGKSNCMHNILPQLRKKNQPAIIVDFTGEMTSKYYDESKGDVILNPYSDKDYSWDFWEDAKADNNLKIISDSLFASKDNDYDQMWVNTSRQLFEDAVDYLKLRKSGYESVEDLYTILAKDSLMNLSSKLKNYPSGNLLDPKNEKTAMSIRTNTIAYISWMKNFREKGKKISLTNWFRELEDSSDESFRGKWLFLTARPDERVVLRGFYTMILDLLINKVMSLEPNMDRRIWMIIDELPSMKKLPSLNMALSEFRKYGGCIMAGMQSLSQLYDIYGMYNASAMLDQFNTKFVFRTEDAKFLDYISNNFGEMEYIEANENYSYGSHEMRDGVSVTRNERRRLLVSKTDISMLNDLEAFVKLPDQLVKVVKVKMEYVNMNKGINN